MESILEAGHRELRRKDGWSWCTSGGRERAARNRASKEGMGLLRRLTAKSFVGRFGATMKRGAEGALEADNKELRRKVWWSW